MRAYTQEHISLYFPHGQRLKGNKQRGRASPASPPYPSYPPYRPRLLPSLLLDASRSLIYYPEILRCNRCATTSSPAHWRRQFAEMVEAAMTALRMDLPKQSAPVATMGTHSTHRGGSDRPLSARQAGSRGAGGRQGGLHVHNGTKSGIEGTMQ